MKPGGGGLTWVGWLMVGAGGVLIYAGMTGQSVVSEVQAVLNGKRVAKAGSSSTTTQAPPPSNSSANAAEHDLLGGGGGSNSSANAKENAMQQSAAQRSLVPYYPTVPIAPELTR